MKPNGIAALSGALALLLVLSGCPDPSGSSNSSDATLQSLVVSEGTLNPAFSPETTTYAVAVAEAVEAITVTAAANHEGAALSANNGRPQSLYAGTNMVTLIVTAEDGATGVYTITVNRAVPETDTTVDALNLDALISAPASDAVPDTTAIDTAQYTGTISWWTKDGDLFTGPVFAPATEYRALVSLTARPGYTFAGVGADSFTRTGAAATNAIDRGLITLTFTTGPSQDSTAPGPVTNLAAAPGLGQVTLSWTDPADRDLNRIEITLSPAVPGISQPLTAAPGTGSKAVRGLANSTSYTFTVTTVDMAGNRNPGQPITQTAQPGLVWTREEQDSIAIPYYVTWLGSRFFAGGSGGAIAHSADGVTWTGISGSPLGSDIVESIAWNGSNLYVAGSRNGKIAWSADGATWTLVTDSTFGNGSFMSKVVASIAWGNSKFVAAGSSGRMAWSSDGATWYEVTSSTFGTTGITDIIWTGSRFVAVGGNKIAYSTDGTSWTQVTTANKPSSFSTAKSLQGLAWDGSGKLVAAGGGGVVIYSTDHGTSWTQVPDSTFSISIAGITWGGDRFIAVGRTAMASSPDGVNWTTLTDPDRIFYSSDNLQKIAYGAGVFVTAVRFGLSSGCIAYSNKQQ